MGKMNSGILGPVRGKVAGVVGSSWKGQPYLRAYTIPGKSETDLQIAQRARFAYVVAAAKYFVGRVFNPYYDKFLTKVSGFNRFVTNNIPKAPSYTAVPHFQVTDGPLYPGSALVATIAISTGIVSLTWDEALGVDGANTDIAIGWVRDPVSNVVWFGTDGTRIDGAMTVQTSGLVTAAGLDCGVFFAKVTGALVNKISRNLTSGATAE